MNQQYFYESIRTYWDVWYSKPLKNGKRKQKRTQAHKTQTKINFDQTEKKEATCNKLTDKDPNEITHTE